MLRDWDIGRALLRNREHKAALIREILSSYPTLSFILVGDSTQEDPEIYSEIVREHPSRILAVYIRNVGAHPERSTAITALAAGVSTAGSTLVLADDTLAAARHAAQHGWIDPAALDEIAHDKASDEGRTGEKIEAPGVETPSAPTVVVDEDVGVDEVT
jgi:phosphatidate phosphatase APP1